MRLIASMVCRKRVKAQKKIRRWFSNGINSIKSLIAKRSFTLLELIIVVIIIGILAAIAAPMYQNFTEKARAADAINTLGALKTAELVYYVGNNHFLLSVGGNGSNSFNDLGVENPTNTTWNYWTDDGYAGTFLYKGSDGVVIPNIQDDLVIHAQRLGSQYDQTQICLGHAKDGRWLWCWTDTGYGPHPDIPNN